MRVPAGEATIRCQALGDLNLPTGRLAICDPADPRRPVIARLMTDRLPVEIGLVEVSPGDERVAYARAGAGAVRWSPIEPAYDVGAGLVAFCDASSLERLAIGELLWQIDVHRVPTWSWAVGEGVALLTAGLGDGRYRAHAGLDAGGRTVAVATSFGIVAAR